MEEVGTSAPPAYDIPETANQFEDRDTTEYVIDKLVSHFDTVDASSRLGGTAMVPKPMSIFRNETSQRTLLLSTGSPYVARPHGHALLLKGERLIL